MDDLPLERSGKFRHVVCEVSTDALTKAV